MFDQEEELGSTEGLERSKERAVCNNQIILLISLNRHQSWPTIEHSLKNWLLLKIYGSKRLRRRSITQVKNIQREEFGGPAANGGEVRIQQVPKSKPDKFGALKNLKTFLFSESFSIHAGCCGLQSPQEEPQDWPTNWTQVGSMLRIPSLISWF